MVLLGSGVWPKYSGRFGKKQDFLSVLEGIRDLIATSEAGFAKLLARNAVLGKETVFGTEMTEVRHQAGLS